MNRRRQPPKRKTQEAASKAQNARPSPRARVKLHHHVCHGLVLLTKVIKVCTDRKEPHSIIP